VRLGVSTSLVYALRASRRPRHEADKGGAS